MGKELERTINFNEKDIDELIDFIGEFGKVEEDKVVYEFPELIEELTKFKNTVYH